jgi:Mg2+-importing ATPase
MLSVLLGLLQEYRASRALDRLRDRLALRCTVRRSGALVECPATEIVPGDVVELRAGGIVPGDRTLLTGEPPPVLKQTDAASPRDGCAFQCTSIVSGIGALLIAEPGADTEYGRIASRLGLDRGQTDFDAA